MNRTLVLGGARSGKSRHAERLAHSLTDKPVYLATSRPWDDDHQARIARHRRDRGPEWETIEEQKQLSAPDLSGRVVVVDCVTLWLTNFFVDLGQDVDACLVAAQSELDRALARDTTWIFVSNELGQGLHAPTEIGRKFTDLQGFMNQYIAARVEAVALLVAGIPLYVKGRGNV
jgi:adenosylcobinamide kinase/adenosylcobinamide-phosphate guanylyltransferase